ncbi:DNA-binding protein [Staphylococcus kloosii]|uniref:DNA-binding protein n=1 Tax=Staphylococcus kloosii TaxID=29384 RepID=UPI0028A3C718|nr:DNA-binding protein [Staphylococcus kloosii]MDT3960174.1 DNA-binding protein [Staphylococcus kloosii]
MCIPLPKIGKPATNALMNKNITTLEDVAKYDKHTLASFHGVGPKAIKILEDNLEIHSLTFNNKRESDLPFELKGDLKCDNAPKRRLMLEFLIATATRDSTLLDQVVHNDFMWEVPGTFTINNKNNFLKELSEHAAPIESMTVTYNISHGKTGAINGYQEMTDGSKIHFADFMEFDSHKKDAKIQKVTSYVIMNGGDS